MSILVFVFRFESTSISSTYCFVHLIDIRYCFAIKHKNVQSCLLLNFQYKPISLQYSWLSVEQPIRFDWVLYKHHREFPINKKTIPMLTCPIEISCDGLGKCCSQLASEDHFCWRTSLITLYVILSSIKLKMHAILRNAAYSAIGYI